MIRRFGLLLCLVLAGCAHSGRVPTESVTPRPEGWKEKGGASWYGKPYHGRKTASGETYDMYDLTAAHRSLPFGTRVEVTRKDTGEKVIVRINDRGPFVKGRIIDLSYGAAKKIHLDRDGVAPVELKVLGTKKERKHHRERQRSSNVSGGCFWIQVGAFSSASNASGVMEKLKKSGFRAVNLVGDDGLNRVRVGPFEREQELVETLKKLHDEWPAARRVECGGP